MTSGNEKVADARRALAAARADGERRATLAAALAEANAALDAARTERAQAARQLAVETMNLEKLGRFSMARVAATIRGTLGDDVRRAEAAKRAAAAAADTAEALVDEAQAKVDAIAREIAGLGDVDARHAEARTALLAALDTPDATALLDVEERIRAADKRAIELADYLTTLEIARSRYRQALAELQQARRDAGNFFTGGGIFRELSKHSRVEDAAMHVVEADASVRRLTRLGAVSGLRVVGRIDLGVSRDKDVFDGSPFVDEDVRERVDGAMMRVRLALAPVERGYDAMARAYAGTEASRVALAAEHAEVAARLGAFDEV